MPGLQVEHYTQAKPRPWVRLLHPASVGTVTGAVLAASGRPSASGVSAQGRLYCLVVGFALGWGVTKGLDWLRWRFLKRLLTYQGWIYNQKSTKTKLWAICLKALKGPGPYQTMEFQSLLPAQPLPDLDDTLNKWLTVSKSLLTPEEYEVTTQAVEEFRKNEGPKLQGHLKQRYDTMTNWLADYWLAAAYLSSRESIAAGSNPYCSNSVPSSRTADPLARAANWIYHTVKYYEMLVKQTLPPGQLMGLVPICMYNYKFVFNSTRVPGEHMDTMSCHPGAKHVIVIRKGHYFKLDMYADDGQGGERCLALEEVYSQLEVLCREAADIPETPLPVAALTGERRDTWCKLRETLKVQNPDTLHAVDSALFVITVDEYIPKDRDDLSVNLLVGRGHNIWFDKSFTYVIFGDCSQGANVEHSVIDGTVMIDLAEYNMVAERYEADGSVQRDPNFEPRKLGTPCRLPWDVTGLEKNIVEAAAKLEKLSGDVDMHVYQTPYGKRLMKQKRMSPDGYIQMAMQLAYYREHKEIVKTYEPSTGRLFNLGRTETVHPVTQNSTLWVKAMDDDKIPRDKCESFLRKAIHEQTAFRLDATAGHGCDRHLLGMYCASRELGMDVPTVFRDKAFQLPFKLSTSQTPTRIGESRLAVDYRACGGGFGAVCKEGYGLSYMLFGEDVVNIHISSWNSCSETSSKKFAGALDLALEDMKKMLG